MDDNSLRFEDSTPLGMTTPSLVPAIVAGAVAAVVGGALWAVVVWITGYEIGYAAVGLGALVGFAMSRATPRRDVTVGVAAALLALVGLVAARIAIAEFVMPQASMDEVLSDPEMMVDAALLDLELNGGFPEDLQVDYATIPAGEIIPDATYERMWSAAEAYEAGLTDTERSRIAAQFVGIVLGSVDTTSRVTAQLTLFDLLWVFLALSTAWKMMSTFPASPSGETQASVETT